MTADSVQRSGNGTAADDPHAISLARKLCYVAPLAVVQVGVYWLFNHFPLAPSRELPLTWIDRSVPFWLWTIWAYFALIAMAAGLPLLVRNALVFRRLLVAYAISMGTAWAFFLLMPTHYPRPPLPEDDSFTRMSYRALLEFDSPECCFPSSHVIVPLLACAALRKDKSLGRWWPLLAACAAVCCLSILTTKQHYVWDLMGGTAAAMLGWLLSAIRETGSATSAR